MTTTLEERREWLREAFTRLKELPSGSAEWTELVLAIDAKLAEWQRDRAAVSAAALAAAP